MISFTIFALNFFADVGKNATKKENPELYASFPSRIIFQWYQPFVVKAWKQQLTQNDFWTTEEKNSSEKLSKIFSKNYEKYSKVSTALWWTFFSEFLITSVFKLASDILVFLVPMIIDLIITFTKENEPKWRGFFYAGLLLTVIFLKVVIGTQYSFKINKIGFRSMTALKSIIFQKSLRVTEKTESVVENLIDQAGAVYDLPKVLNSIWSEPFQVIIAVYLLYEHLGVSILAAVVVMVLLLPIAYLMAKKVKNLSEEQRNAENKRISKVKEILGGMKVLKLNAWEDKFEEKVTKIREKELKLLRTRYYIDIGSKFIWLCSPFVVGRWTRPGGGRLGFKLKSECPIIL